MDPALHSMTVVAPIADVGAVRTSQPLAQAISHAVSSKQQHAKPDCAEPLATQQPPAHAAHQRRVHTGHQRVEPCGAGIQRTV